MTKTRLEVSDAESKEKGNKQIRVIWKFQSFVWNPHAKLTWKFEGVPLSRSRI